MKPFHFFHCKNIHLAQAFLLFSVISGIIFLWLHHPDICQILSWVRPGLVMSMCLLDSQMPFTLYSTPTGCCQTCGMSDIMQSTNWQACNKLRNEAILPNLPCPETVIYWKVYATLQMIQLTARLEVHEVYTLTLLYSQYKKYWTLPLCWEQAPNLRCSLWWLLGDWLEYECPQVATFEITFFPPSDLDSITNPVMHYSVEVDLWKMQTVTSPQKETILFLPSSGIDLEVCVCSET